MECTRIEFKNKRLDLLKVRVKEYGLDSVLQAIQSISQSPHLKGQNKSGWMITFDWFVKPNNVIKVLEGNYIDKEPNGNTGNPTTVGFKLVGRIVIKGVKTGKEYR